MAISLAPGAVPATVRAVAHFGSGVAPRRHTTVVLADPDPDWRRILRVYLTASGYTVLEAVGVEEARRHARSVARGVIVAELEIAVQLLAASGAADTSPPAVPVVIVTTQAFECDALAAAALGAAGFLKKPCRLREVAALLAGLVRAVSFAGAAAGPISGALKREGVAVADVGARRPTSRRAPRDCARR